VTSRDGPMIVTCRIAVRKNSHQPHAVQKKEPAEDAVRKIVGQARAYDGYGVYKVPSEDAAEILPRRR
jgi:hypothetical protein